jgi:DNA-binding MarR family transcriptional regulator
MKLTKAERRVLTVLSMMHGRNGVRIPDQKASADRVLQRLCARNFVEKIEDREGSHRYKITDSGITLIKTVSQPTL